jgi:hypothetical protein
MDRRRRLLTDWKMACLFFLLLAVGLTILYLQAGAVPYRFLEGRKPFYSKIEVYRGIYAERQIYSWGDDFRDVSRQARKELEPLGFLTFFQSGARNGIFVHRDRLSIRVRYGRSSSRTDMYLNPADAPPGVTVEVERGLPGNWLTKARMWMQGK